MNHPSPLEVGVVLERTPRVLHAMLHGLDDSWSDRPYGQGTWSAKEVVAHLVFGERTDWLPRIRQILESGDARAFDPFDRAGHAPLMRTHTLAQLLQIFSAERDENLRTLRAMNLSSADLSRRGLHPALGEVTLGNLLATWAAHDLNHVAQIAKAIAFQLRDRVGPWEAYLSIMAPPAPR